LELPPRTSPLELLPGTSLWNFPWNFLLELHPGNFTPGTSPGTSPLS